MHSVFSTSHWYFSPTLFRFSQKNGSFLLSSLSPNLIWFWYKGFFVFLPFCPSLFFKFDYSLLSFPSFHFLKCLSESYLTSLIPTSLWLQISMGSQLKITAPKCSVAVKLFISIAERATGVRTSMLWGRSDYKTRTLQRQMHSCLLTHYNGNVLIAIPTAGILDDMKYHA